MRVLAVDPGERVGWASGVIKDGGVRPKRPSARYIGAPDKLPHPHARIEVEPIKLLEVQAHGIAFLKDAALAIHNAVVIEDRYDVVVYETFKLTARGARVSVGGDMQTSQFIGAVRGYCWLNPRVQLVPQDPGAKRSAIKSMRAHPSGGSIQERIAKLPKSHDDAHDGDALLHLWHFFFERYV